MFTCISRDISRDNYTVLLITGKLKAPAVVEESGFRMSLYQCRVFNSWDAVLLVILIPSLLIATLKQTSASFKSFSSEKICTIVPTQVDRAVIFRLANSARILIKSSTNTTMF